MTYNECAFDKSEGFWCPTNKAFPGQPYTGNNNWGKCGYQCPLPGKQKMIFLIPFYSINIMFIQNKHYK